MNTPSALVTGSLGFIGSNMVNYLVDKGWNVYGIDNLSTGKMGNANNACIQYIGDVLDRELILEILSKDVDYVFHFAALARVPRSIGDPFGTHIANVNGTLNLLQCAREYVKLKKFVYSSSSSVYGDQDTPKMVETMSCNPVNPYALQKYQGEQYCEMFSNLFGVDCVSLRYFNCYGTNQIVGGAYSLVIGKFMQQISEGKKMTIYGDGSHTRAYTWVGDVVRANYLAVTNDTGDYSVFNVGTDVETSVLEIADMLGGEYELIQPHPRGDAEEARKCADYSRIQKALGWEPKVAIEDGIKMLQK